MENTSEFAKNSEKDRRNFHEKNGAESEQSLRAGATYEDVFPEVGIHSSEVSPRNYEDGCEIDTFAQLTNTTSEDVWRKLRSGELLGRLVEGRVLVFETHDATKRFSQTTPFNIADLPPFPNAQLDVVRHPASVSRSESHSQEIALLIDHLSIAKEENREIIRLTQDALNKMEDLNKQIISMKDTSLKEREEKIEKLQAELEEQRRKIDALQREKEDLETLTRAII